MAFTKDSRRPSAGKNRKLITRKREGKEMPKTGHENELIRLNKYLASTGICSRREADELITAGLVTINGKLITELGVKVSPGDVVKYNGETLREEKKVYLILNKPKDYVTTVEDPHAKRTVLDLVKGACKERIYPVGRLDRNTTGVLLLTNDGELTKRLTHPRFEKLKIYHVHLNKNVKASDLEKIATGVSLEDGNIKADSISYADPVDKSQVGIELHSGKNHIVRRIFESLGYEVVKLDRVYFAGLTKKNLQRGEWRFLTEREIAMLKMNAFK
jgi:23S rRNA pseudouridine2605 synthase